MFAMTCNILLMTILIDIGYWLPKRQGYDPVRNVSWSMLVDPTSWPGCTNPWIQGTLHLYGGELGCGDMCQPMFRWVHWRPRRSGTDPVSREGQTVGRNGLSCICEFNVMPACWIREISRRQIWRLQWEHHPIYYPSVLLMCPGFGLGYLTQWCCDWHGEEINFTSFGLSDVWDDKQPSQWQFIVMNWIPKGSGE